jgi:hypothetical protein
LPSGSATAAPDAPGSYGYPWVRLHAIRDYYSMAALAAEHDVHVTFNLTPVLLRQIDDYFLNGATDSALELTRHAAEKLNKSQIEEVLSTFFDADWHNQVYVHPRYRELFEQRTAGTRFSRQDLRDLQMWFNLAWFGHEFRSGDVRLITGDTVKVARFVRQQRGFSHDDLLAMVDDQYKILRAVVPIHRALQDSGRIEVSTTPAFHPILPLLIDTDSAYVDRPGTSRPTRFAHPEDAATHVELASNDYLTRFGRRPTGMWPAEGAVSVESVQMLEREGVNWLVTDAGVLARSGQWGYRASDPAVLCQPYRASDDAPSIAVFFRDTDRAYLFPFSDQVLYPRTMGAQTALTRLAIEPARLGRLLAASVRLGAVRLVARERVRNVLAKRRSDRARNEGAARFALRVDVIHDGRSAHATLVGGPQANAAAAGASETVRSMMEDEVSEPGVWMPEQVISPPGFFSRLARHELTVELPAINGRLEKRQAT